MIVSHFSNGRFQLGTEQCADLPADFPTDQASKQIETGQVVKAVNLGGVENYREYLSVRIVIS